MPTLLGWWKLPPQDPLVPAWYPPLVVEPQRYHRRPANSRPSNDKGPVLAPLETIRPALGPGVKKRDDGSRVRITCFCFDAFEAIASGTTQPQIFTDRQAALTLGDDMLNLETHW